MDLRVPSDSTWSYHPAQVVRSESKPADTRRHGDGVVVFVESFSTSSDRDWCELIRDVAAVANSGGGTILIRCQIGDKSSDPHCPRTIDLAASDVVHRLALHTDDSYADIRVQAVDRDSQPVVEIHVGAARFPLGFTKAGVYRDAAEPPQEHQVFAAGSFYFRHGRESLPGNSADMRDFFERPLSAMRNKWLREFRRAVDAPLEDELLTSAANLKPVRIVNDPDAPPLHPQDVDRLYPWRQKDLVRELNHRLGRHALNSYDIQATRRQHHLDDRPEFVFRLEGAGRRYSPAVADWIMDQYEHDPTFFQQARSADHEMLRMHRRKPR
jgi:hypothetical protein